MDFPADSSFKRWIDRLQETLPSRMRALQVPGLSMAVLRESRLAWLGAFGLASRATGEPVTEETLFQAASLTKPVFAALVLRLWEEGLLDLDAPLVSYLPSSMRTGNLLFDHIVDDPQLDSITIRRVLSHQTGFRNWAPKGEQLRLELGPGTRFSYSGEGYVFLQRTVEALTGREGAGLLEERVLRPLAMTHTCCACHDQGSLTLAQGHDADGQPGEVWRPEALNAAYSLHCTPADFARFMAAMMPKSDCPSILQPKTLREMLKPQVPLNDSAPWQDDWPRPQVVEEPGLSWGLGWGLQARPAGGAFWHWGDNGNFKAFAMGVPGRGSGLVVMANGKRADLLWRELLVGAVGEPLPAIDWLARVGGLTQAAKR